MASGAEIVKVRVFNVKYSPNLGDGLLCECLEAALIEHGCDSEETYSVDLAARTTYSGGNSSRGVLMRVLEAMPAELRRLALHIPIQAQLRRRWLPHYARTLDGVDAVVVGGGNLFTDVDLNFPTKLSAIVSMTAERRLPLAIYGVGVTSRWSDQGKRMLRHALASARTCYVSVRDEASKRHFDEHFGDVVGVRSQIVRDPGLMISRYVQPKVLSPESAIVGICISSAIAVRYHSDITISDRNLLSWYVRLCQQLQAAGLKLLVFTNGSPEDVAFAERVRNEGLARGLSLTIEQPRTPRELAVAASTASILIAFRMHALIAAFSFGRQIIGLRWDPKLDSFMQSVGMPELVFDATRTSPEALIQATAQPKIPLSADKVAGDAFAQVGNLVHALSRDAGRAGTTKLSSWS
ncbi:polysaccharide pyruvyl transferase family protein [Sinorhizobium fredii]|uniref:polysaccharide pyruvyl transferase family protein n=1 Tax=Rhizobium fredii TaxID=380 RepID=UPI0004B09EC6|nr:polysaccharide pyruvyl transferase family protein [Sinorhizobium fredii]